MPAFDHSFCSSFKVCVVSCTHTSAFVTAVWKCALLLETGLVLDDLPDLLARFDKEVSQHGQKSSKYY